MGRYTTVQAYSDNNPKLVHVSYDQAKGKDAAEGESGGKAGGKLVVEKTDQVMGSCAGAGSGEFHTYRAHRRREMHRVAAMDEEMREEEATSKLRSAMEQGQKDCEERTRKKSEKRKRKEAEKRKRKKQAKEDGATGAKQAKTDAAATKGASSSSSSSGGGGGKYGSGGGASSSSEGDAAEEFVYIPEADQAASGGDGGAPAAYKNDGSFLEKMQKELGLAGSGGCGVGSAAGGGGSKAIASK